MERIIKDYSAVCFRNIIGASGGTSSPAITCSTANLIAFEADKCIQHPGCTSRGNYRVAVCASEHRHFNEVEKKPIYVYHDHRSNFRIQDLGF